MQKIIKLIFNIQNFKYQVKSQEFIFIVSRLTTGNHQLTTINYNIPMPLRILAFLFGSFITFRALASAVRTFVLPRAVPDTITRIVFQSIDKIFALLLKPTRTYEQRDRIMAYYAPVALLSMPPAWLFLISIGFTFIYYALGVTDWAEAFTISGSSLLTLGFARSAARFPVAEFIQATMGPLLIALLISYLPTMYAAFSAREVVVNQLTVRAGSPPSPVQMLLRYHRLNRLEKLGDEWEDWETWFVEIEESHTSLAALVFFRSPQPEQSWVNAAGCVLDTAALRLSVLDLPGDKRGELLLGGNEIPPDARAAITLRAGFIALRRVADFFGVNYNPNPRFPQDPIAISREDFDQACEMLAAQGLSLRSDRDKAWLDYAGWRVNYDSVLIALKKLTMAPPSDWLGNNGF